MKVRRVVTATLITSLAFSLIATAWPNVARATSDTIYVGMGASGDNTGCSSPDYGLVTLGAKAAIGHALNAANDGDTVYLCAGTYDLTTGILIRALMADDITIQGAGAGKTILDGGGDVQILNIRRYIDLKIKDLTFYDGFDDSDGGAICHRNGTLTLIRVNFLENVSDGFGGAVACAGDSLTILNSKFVGNVADLHGGAIDVHQETGTIIRDSEFIDNHSNSEGGALGSNGSALDVQHSLFKGNTAGKEGGAIWYPRYGGLTLKRNHFVANRSDGVGGAISLLDDRQMKRVGRSVLTTNRFSGNRADSSRTSIIGYKNPWWW